MPGVKGRSGRRPKSVDEHLQNGTFRPHRHAQRAELAIPGASLNCPFESDSEAFKAWQRIVETLPKDRVTLLDSDALTTYCECWQLLREVWPKFREDPISKDVRIAALALLDRVSILGRSFGMSPMARMSLRFPEPEPTTPDPLQEFFDRRRKR